MSIDLSKDIHGIKWGIPGDPRKVYTPELPPQVLVPPPPKETAKESQGHPCKPTKFKVIEEGCS